MNRKLTYLVCILAVMVIACGCRKAAPQPAEEAVAPAAPETAATLTQAGVCLTFDDRNLADWEAMLPVFDKYGAHVTFFINGEIGPAEAERLKAIQTHGHAIGAHGLLHANYRQCVKEKGMTPEEYAQADSLGQLEAFKAHGVPVTSYACPMSSRDATLDELLKPHFRHIRSGAFLREGQRLADRDDVFVPIADVASHFYFNGKGIDKYPENTQEMVDEALERAAARGELIVFYAHRIAPDPCSGHHIEPVEVERILQKGQQLGLRFYSFDELP